MGTTRGHTHYSDYDEINCLILQPCWYPPSQPCNFALLYYSAAGQVLTQHPFAPVFQTLATLTNQPDCCLYQDLDHAKQPEFIFIPADVSAWWNQSGKSMNDNMWYPQPEKKQHTTSPAGETTGL
ncbi:endogenous retroviral envelope protein HEMO-like [Nycticebus coucang]|uniref:endogenous retroviral envelope protein HEMO-like n=1 Tax=Nycticebus coucang TaxID=9470 RepID=UPI00234C0B81|nr:endogenous retroviral envelope protein HEMO-like [Nycticebus coucang]